MQNHIKEKATSHQPTTRERAQAARQQRIREALNTPEEQEALKAIGQKTFALADNQREEKQTEQRVAKNIREACNDRGISCTIDTSCEWLNDWRDHSIYAFAEQLPRGVFVTTNLETAAQHITNGERVVFCEEVNPLSYHDYDDDDDDVSRNQRRLSTIDVYSLYSFQTDGVVLVQSKDLPKEQTKTAEGFAYHLSFLPSEPGYGVERHHVGEEHLLLADGLDRESSEVGGIILDAMNVIDPMMHHLQNLKTPQSTEA